MSTALDLALLAFLSDELGVVDLQYRPGDEPKVLTGGNSAKLYRFTLSAAPQPFDGPLVLRLIRNTSHERAARELEAQQAAANAGYPTPSVLLKGDSSAGLSSPFSVTRAVAGRTPLAAAGIVGLPRLFREIPDMLATAMSQLHSLPIDFADGVDDLLNDITDPDVLSWLETRRPSGYERVLCHGDLHGENLLVADGEIAAVLDWELACGGPRELDIARTSLILAVLPGISRPATRLLASAAARSARRFEDSYRQTHAIDDDMLAWFDVAHCARALNLAMGQGSVADVWRPTIPALKARLATRMASYR